jgi:malic enzyme
MRIGKPSKKVSTLTLPETKETLTVEREESTYRIVMKNAVAAVTGVFEEVCVHFEDFTLCLKREELEKLFAAPGS